MNKSSDGSREDFVNRAEDLGGSMQLEFYKAAREMLGQRYDERLSKKLAAALANYVFHFGLVAPDHAADKQLLAVLMAEKEVCLT